jgi:UDP-glucose 4-epimerase
MKILVVGGAGYIGSHVVKYLQDLGEEVIVVDNLQNGHRESVDVNFFYQIDIRDKDKLSEVFKKHSIDTVIHFAANSLVGESMENPLDYYNNNVYGMQCLLEIMKDFNVKRIVFSSSAAFYGEPIQMPILESCIDHPKNTYGETNLTNLKMMKWVDNAYGIKYVSLRYFNAAGAHPSGVIGEDHSPETHLIPLVLQVPLCKRDKIYIFGDDYVTKDGTCIRDYIHVLDLASAHYLSVKYLDGNNSSSIFNLGSGEGFSVREIIEVARKITGNPIPAEVKERRVGDPAVLIASSEKAKKILNWQPKYNSIEKIITDAWNWHKKNPNGYCSSN